jgi:hypothetical protein
VFFYALPTWRFRSPWMGVIVHSAQSVYFAFLILGLVLGLAQGCGCFALPVPGFFPFPPPFSFVPSIHICERHAELSRAAGSNGPAGEKSLMTSSVQWEEVKI